MTKVDRLTHLFVDDMPNQLDRGILYVSLQFDTMAHLCCCGCGHEIITPLSPSDWNFTYDGSALTVNPSIGNWSYACRSHYVIRRGQVIWAGSWSNEQVAFGRAKDRETKARQFDELPLREIEDERGNRFATRSGGVFHRLKRWFR